MRNTDLQPKIYKRRPVCLVKDTDSRKKVCVETLYADGTWLENRRREPEQHLLDKPDNLIFLSAWYRHRLGLDGLKSGKLDITPDANFCRRIGWQLRACVRHPQIAVVMSTVLAIVGAGFGIVGIAAWLQTANLPIYVWVSVTLAGVVVIFLGLCPLAVRAQN